MQHAIDSVAARQHGYPRMQEWWVHLELFGRPPPFLCKLLPHPIYRGVVLFCSYRRIVLAAVLAVGFSI